MVRIIKKSVIDDILISSTPFRADVGPQASFKCDATTVSQITYMCIRYIDHVNNEEMVSVMLI